MPEQTSNAAPPGPPDVPPGIPDHELLRKIGEGSYGEVWLARSTLGTHRAVKIVHRPASGNERPYEREFAGLKNFEPISRGHEGVVDVLQVGRNEEASYFYYVMELADDGSEVRSEKYEGRSLGEKAEDRPASGISNPESYAPLTLDTKTHATGLESGEHPAAPSVPRARKGRLLRVAAPHQSADAVPTRNSERGTRNASHNSHPRSHERGYSPALPPKGRLRLQR